MKLTLNLILPAIEIAESVGNRLPHQLACQRKCIACLPRPRKNWQAALVLPQEDGVLETLERRLACGL